MPLTSWSPTLAAIAAEAGARAHGLAQAGETIDVLRDGTLEGVRAWESVLRDAVATAYETDRGRAANFLRGTAQANSAAMRSDSAVAALLIAAPWYDSEWHSQMPGGAVRSWPSVVWDHATDVLDALREPWRVASVRLAVDEAHWEAATGPAVPLEPALAAVRIHPLSGADYLGLAGRLEQLGDPLNRLTEDESPKAQEATARTLHTARLMVADAPTVVRLAFAVAAARGSSAVQQITVAVQTLRRLTTDDAPEHFVGEAQRMQARLASPARFGGAPRPELDSPDRLRALTMAHWCADGQVPTWYLLQTLGRLLPLSVPDRGDRALTDATVTVLEVLRSRHGEAGELALAALTSESAYPALIATKLHETWKRTSAENETRRLARTGNARLSLITGASVPPSAVSLPRRPIDDARRRRVDRQPL